MWLQQNCKAAHSITTLKTTTQQVALVLDRVTYSLPYHTLTKAAIKQVESLIRGSYKMALGLPQYRTKPLAKDYVALMTN